MSAAMYGPTIRTAMINGVRTCTPCARGLAVPFQGQPRCITPVIGQPNVGGSAAVLPQFPYAARMPLHIGIAACSAEGAALCYRTICVEGARLLGSHAHPEVSMHTPSLAGYMQLIYRGNWQGVGEMMLASARKLAAVGADFLICPDNTLHQALPYVVPRSPLPWLHIADSVM